MPTLWKCLLTHVHKNSAWHDRLLLTLVVLRNSWEKQFIMRLESSSEDSVVPRSL